MFVGLHSSLQIELEVSSGDCGIVCHLHPTKPLLRPKHPLVYFQPFLWPSHPQPCMLRCADYRAPSAGCGLSCPHFTRPL